MVSSIQSVMGRSSTEESRPYKPEGEGSTPSAPTNFTLDGMSEGMMRINRRAMSEARA